MKVLLIVLILFSFTSVLATNSPHLHLDLEMTSREYHFIIHTQSDSISNKLSQVEDNDELLIVKKLGTRNLEWIRYINSFRSANKQIILTSKNIKTGISITNPVKYSPKTILSSYDFIQKNIPNELKSILFENTILPKDPPVSDEVFILWARKIDHAYNYSLRWKLISPYLPWYASQKYKDLRGYYYITHTPNFKTNLKKFASLPTDKREQYQKWLTDICINAQSNYYNCSVEFSQHLKNGSLNTMVDYYLPKAESLWKSFFTLDRKRSDITWSWDRAKIFTSIPFLRPINSNVYNFVKFNIESEWRLPFWQLRLDFQSHKNDIPHIIFEPGVNANVNELGGNIIRMDANTSLAEGTSQLIIRHEFGHILGFPDCYLEFYDSSEQLMINYQLDIDNIMCSRAGRVQQLHYEQLKNIYKPF